MNFAEIIGIFTALTTLSLSVATVWMARSAKNSAISAEKSAMATELSVIAAEKTMELMQDQYEKDNTPLLAFDFDFSDSKKPIFAELNDELEKHGNHPYFLIRGKLSNLSITPAVECIMNIIRTDQGKETAKTWFEEDIFISYGLVASSSIYLDKPVDSLDWTKYSDEIKHFNGVE